MTLEDCKKFVAALEKCDTAKEAMDLCDMVKIVPVRKILEGKKEEK